MSFSIDQVVADCVAAVEQEKSHAGVAVNEVVARACSKPTEIEAAIGHPRDNALLSTWHNSDTLTVLHVVWPPAVELMPHDHLMWAAIGLYGGCEDNEIFRTLPNGTLESRQTKTLRSGDTVLLGDDTVHAVANPTREWTGAIHVYGGDYFAEGRGQWADSTSPREPFDVEGLRTLLSNASTAAKELGADG